MAKSKWRRVLVVIALCVGIGIYFMSVESYYRCVSPPSGIGIENLSKHVPIVRIKEVIKNGNVFYLAEGQIPPSYVLASGPPVYVFDSDGNPVEWILDSGDQPSLMEKWRTTKTREIPLDRVLRNIKESDIER